MPISFISQRIKPFVAKKDILVGPDGDINKPETWFIMGVLKKLDLYRPGPWDNYTFEELELLKRGELYNQQKK